MPVINVLPFESPAQVTPEEIVAIAAVLHAGAVVTITADPSIATLLLRMSEGWASAPEASMTVEVGEPRETPFGHVTRDFTFRLRASHWMAPVAEGRGFDNAV